MGKPKNKGKKGQDEDFDDDSTDVVLNSEAADEEDAKPQTKSAGKKKSRRRKDDDWEEDVAAELAALSVENNLDDVNGEEEDPVPVPKKKEKKKNKNKSKAEEEDEDVIMEEEVQKNKKGKQKPSMATFQLLMEDDDDDNRGSDENEEEEKDIVIEEKPKEVVESKSKSKKDKKKEKKKEQKEEDIDAILAELEKPTEKTSKKKKKKGGDNEPEEGGKTQIDDFPTEEELEAKMQAKVVTMEDLEEEDDDDRKQKKKKGKKEATGDEEEEGNEKEEDGEDAGEVEESTVKSAAQKRKEKREREKLKKQQEKKKQKSKSTEESAEGKPAASGEGEAVGDAAGVEKKDEDDTEKEEKEGKKKKKKGEKEEKKKKPKAPVAAIKAQLEAIRLEEERIRKEEEECDRKAEEERQRKEEEKRLKEEKRLRRKQKEKEKKEELKKEGKLLTEKQKKDRQRAMQMLEEMKARGIDVPNRDEVVKKRPVYTTRKKNQKQQQRTEDTPSPVEDVPEIIVEEKTPEPETKIEEAPTEEKEDVAEAWDAEEEIKDEWDADSEKEEEEEKPAETVVPEKEEEAEESEEEEEEEESEEDESSEEESSEEESEDDDLTPIERARDRIMKRREEAEKQRTIDVLRSPVVCVLGHVDTGKTKILDKLRRTNVQDGEAGGITQQIGATNVPEQAIRDQTKMCKEFSKKELKLPGLLIIDTPGHQSFSNLRSRGSSLCDIAILVVDIMHGLEPQTIESINLLKQRKTPFIIALNKVDRLYQWKPMPQTDVMNVVKKQNPQTKGEFDTRSREVITQIAEQGLNAALFYENKNPKEYISLVPTSAHSGDGMGNLIALLCELSQTMLAKRLSYTTELQATVMEVKALHGLGTTVDVILVNGRIKEGDMVVVPGTEGPIVTQVRGLLMPEPMRELRVKSQWEHHKEVKAAQGVKLIAKDLEKAIAGLPLYVVKDQNQDEVEYYKEEVSIALKEALSSIKLTERGVFVQASTLGSLEALLEFLKTSNIPYAGINIGPVHRKDIMKASIMLEHDTQYAVILAFDVRVEREAQEMADNLGVTIFTADIIYHLFDKFMAYRDSIKKKNQDLYRHIAVFPCKVRILPQFIFNSRDPIVCGVVVEDGFLKEGTPLCVPNKEFLDIGRVTSVEANHKAVEIARKGMEVCIKVESIPGDSPKMIGRHFEETDMLVSKISRNSIDAVKNYFRDDMQKQDWQLMVELKKRFEIL